MAPTNMVTRCPQCGTSFRITPAQIQSARGAVRCGACLHIFKARDHLVGAKAPSPDPALVRKPNGSQKVEKAETASTAPSKPRPAPKPSSPRSSKPDTARSSETKENRQDAKPETQLRFDQSQIDADSSQLDDDDFLISDDMGQKPAEDDPFGIGEQTRARSTHSLFDRTIDPNKEDQEPKDDTDESWAMSLLEEEDEQTAQIDVSRSPSERAQDSSSFELTNEPEAPENISEDQEAHITFQLAESEAEAAEDFQGDRMSARDPQRSALLMNIDPEPVEMNWARKHKRPRRWLWPSLALLALVALVVQVAWLQFDRFNRVEPYRSVYSVICPLVGCELPDLVDRSRIRAYNLVVRNHPDREGALVVDAILLNTAGFNQPFPDLVLEFSDLDGKTVAAREFAPDEYLSGELAGRSSMPANQPVHLTLELVDPGETAVNYRAYIPE